MNLPNKLTILRILLVPLIAAVYLISAMSDALGGSVVIMGIRASLQRSDRFGTVCPGVGHGLL